MAKNEQLAGEGDLATSSAPRRQSARIQSQQLRASREPEHLDEEESMRGRKRKRTAAPASKSLENGGVGESLKKDAMTKEEQYVAEKELLARRRAELLDDEGHGKKMANSLMRRRVDAESQKREQNAGNAPSVNEKENVAAETDSEVLNECGGEENGVVSAVGNVANVGEKSDYAKVKETLRLFNKHYLHFVQEEEKRCRKEVVEQKAQKGSKKAKKGNAKKDNMKKSPKQSSSKTKSKDGDADLAKTKKLAKRPDLKAITKMLDNNDVLNAQKRIGEIPGIRVGHQFYSRAEMVVVGFHSHWLNGIDYMGQNYKKMEEYKNYEFPLAVAIVLSGMYEDDLDNAEDIVYTGQGGHNLTGDKRQIKDQTLERGNLALKNCMVNDLPVRVIRGHENRSSYTGKVYTYDGLYKVIKYWADKGISGFTVYKYLLQRVVGQPMLTTNQVQFVYGRVPQSVSDLRGLVCEDIAGGQENFPIPATNLVDDPPVPPSGFKYISSIQTAKNVVFPATVPGCSCKGMCIDPRTCACAKLNGSDFPYVQRDGGRLIEAKDVVYECGPKCGCGPDCINRVSQRGLKYHLEVFRAPRKGWAVRSWDFIPSGAPVCEYIGILKKSEDMENASENNYIFDIDCLQTMRGLGGRERRSGDLSIQTNDQMDSHHEHKHEPEFCIDAGARGNIARFINHSCEPNLFVQCVLSSHHDMKLARVVLFAADNIPPLQELTYDYGYALNSVLGADGKVKRMPCYCGAADCRKRLF